MYILKLKGLKEQLQAAELGEQERFKYLLGFLIINGIAGVGAVTRQPGNMWQVFDVLLSAFLMLFAVWYSYRKNGGPAGTAFLDRFVSLGFVIGIRQVLLGLAMLFLHQEISYLLSFLGYGEALDEGSFDWIGSILNLVPSLYFLWAIGRHMLDVSRAAVTLPARPGILTGVRGAPAGEQSSRRLERFVEAVVQRETAEAAGIEVIGKKPARPKTRIIRRRTSRR